MEIPASIPTNFAPDDPMLVHLIASGVLGGGGGGPQPPEGFVVVRQPNGTITRQPNGQINYAPLP